MTIIYIFGFIMGILAQLPLFLLKETLLKKENKTLTKDVRYKMFGLIAINAILILSIVWMMPSSAWESLISIVIALVDGICIVYVVNTKYFEPKLIK